MVKRLVMVILFLSFFASPVLAGQGVPKPGRTDDGLRTFLKNDVDTMGDAQTYYRGSNIGLSPTEKAFLLSNESFLSPPGFFESTSYVNNGYAGQHVMVDNELYIHERLGADGNPSDKFAKWTPSSGFTQLSNSTSQFCDEGSYAVNKSKNQILWIVGSCGVLNNTEVYDISSDQWFDTVAEFPSEVKTGNSEDFGMTGQMPTTTISGDSYSYYFGGFESAGHGDWAYRYNWNSNTWSRIADLPDTWDMATASHSFDHSDGNEYIYLTAGEINGSGPTQQFWRYNVDQDQYTQLNEIPTEVKSNGGVFVSIDPANIDNKILFISGRPQGEGSDAMAIYDIDTQSWSTYKTGATGGFIGIGLKQPSASVFYEGIYSNRQVLKLFVNPTTHADHIGYRTVPVQILSD